MDEGGIDSVSLQSAFPDLHFPNIHVSEEPGFSKTQLSSFESSSKPSVENPLATTAQSSPQLLITEYSPLEDQAVDERTRFSRFSAHLIQQNLLLSTEQDESKRTRSSSPLWIPGETSTFAEVVRSGSVSRNTSRAASPEKLHKEQPFINKLISQRVYPKQMEKLKYKTSSKFVQSQPKKEETPLLVTKSKTKSVEHTIKPSTSLQTELSTFGLETDLSEQRAPNSKQSKKKGKSVPSSVKIPEKIETEKTSVQIDKIFSQAMETEPKKPVKSTAEGEKCTKREKVKLTAPPIKKEEEKKQNVGNQKAHTAIKDGNKTKTLSSQFVGIDLSDELLREKYEKICFEKTESVSGNLGGGSEICKILTPDEEKLDKPVIDVPVPSGSKNGNKKKSKKQNIAPEPAISPKNIECELEKEKHVKHIADKVDFSELENKFHQDPILEYFEGNTREISSTPTMTETIRSERIADPEFEEYYENGKLIRRVIVRKTIIRTRKIIKTTSGKIVSENEEPIITFDEEISSQPISSDDQINSQIVELPSSENDDIEIAEKLNNIHIEGIKISTDKNIITAEIQPNQSTLDSIEVVKSDNFEKISDETHHETKDGQSHSTLKTGKKPKAKKAKSSGPYPISNDAKLMTVIGSDENVIWDGDNLISKNREDESNSNSSAPTKNEKIVSSPLKVEEPIIHLTETIDEPKLSHQEELVKDNCEIKNYPKSKKKSKKTKEANAGENVASAEDKLKDNNFSLNSEIYNPSETEEKKTHIDSSIFPEPLHGSGQDKSDLIHPEERIEKSVIEKDDDIVLIPKLTTDKGKSIKKHESKTQNSKINLNTEEQNKVEVLAPPSILDRSFVDDFLHSQRNFDLPLNLLSELDKSDEKVIPIDKTLDDSNSNNIASSVAEKNVLSSLPEKCSTKSTKSSKKQKSNKKFEKYVDPKLDIISPSESSFISSLKNIVSETKQDNPETEELKIPDACFVPVDMKENLESLDKKSKLSRSNETLVLVSEENSQIELKPHKVEQKTPENDPASSASTKENKDISKKMKKRALKENKTTPSINIGLDNKTDSPCKPEESPEVKNEELIPCDIDVSLEIASFDEQLKKVSDFTPSDEKIDLNPCSKTDAKGETSIILTTEKDESYHEILKSGNDEAASDKIEKSGLDMSEKKSTDFEHSDNESKLIADSNNFSQFVVPQAKDSENKISKKNKSNKKQKQKRIDTSCSKDTAPQIVYKETVQVELSDSQPENLSIKAETNLSLDPLLIEHENISLDKIILPDQVSFISKDISQISKSDEPQKKGKKLNEVVNIDQKPNTNKEKVGQLITPPSTLTSTSEIIPVFESTTHEIGKKGKVLYHEEKQGTKSTTEGYLPDSIGTEFSPEIDDLEKMVDVFKRDIEDEKTAEDDFSMKKDTKKEEGHSNVTQKKSKKSKNKEKFIKDFTKKEDSSKTKSPIIEAEEILEHLKSDLMDKAQPSFSSSDNIEVYDDFKVGKAIAIESSEFNEKLENNPDTQIQVISDDIIVDEDVTKIIDAKVPQVTKKSKSKKQAPKNTNLVEKSKCFTNPEVSSSMEKVELNEPKLVGESGADLISNEVILSVKVESFKDCELPIEFIKKDNGIIMETKIEESVEFLTENEKTKNQQVLPKEKCIFSDAGVEEFIKPTNSDFAETQFKNIIKDLSCAKDAIPTSILTNSSHVEEPLETTVVKSPLENIKDHTPENADFDIHDKNIKKKKKKKNEKHITIEHKSGEANAPCSGFNDGGTSSFSQENELCDIGGPAQSFQTTKSHSSPSEAADTKNTEKDIEIIKNKKSKKSVTFEVPNPADGSSVDPIKELEFEKLIGSESYTDQLEIAEIEYSPPEETFSPENTVDSSLDQSKHKKNKSKKSKSIKAPPVQPISSENRDEMVSKILVEKSKPGKIIETVFKPSNEDIGDSTAASTPAPILVEEFNVEISCHQPDQAQLDEESGKIFIEAQYPEGFSETKTRIKLDSSKILCAASPSINDEKEIKTAPAVLNLLESSIIHPQTPFLNAAEESEISGVEKITTEESNFLSTDPSVVANPNLVWDRKDNQSKKKKGNQKSKPAQPEPMQKGKVDSIDQTCELVSKPTSFGVQIEDITRTNQLPESVPILPKAIPISNEKQVGAKKKNKSKNLGANSTPFVEPNESENDNKDITLASIQPEVESSNITIDEKITMIEKKPCLKVYTIITGAHEVVETDNLMPPCILDAKKGSKNKKAKKSVETVSIHPSEDKTVDTSVEGHKSKPTLTIEEPLISEVEEIDPHLPPTSTSSSTKEEIDAKKKKPKGLKTAKSDFNQSVDHLNDEHSEKIISTIVHLEDDNVKKTTSVDILESTKTDIDNASPTTSSPVSFEEVGAKKKKRKGIATEEAFILPNEFPCEEAPIIPVGAEEADYIVGNVVSTIPEFSKTIKDDIDQNVSPIVDIKKESNLEKKKKNGKLKSSPSVAIPSSPPRDTQNIDGNVISTISEFSKTTKDDIDQNVSPNVDIKKESNLEKKKKDGKSKSSPSVAIPSSPPRDTQNIDGNVISTIPEFSKTIKDDIDQNVSPIVDIKKESNLEKKKKDGKSKSSPSVAIPSSPPRDTQNIDVTTSQPKSHETDHILPTTKTTTGKTVPSEGSADKLPLEDEKLATFELTQPVAADSNLKEVSGPEGKLDNSALKSKRDLKKRKAKPRTNQPSSVDLEIASPVADFPQVSSQVEPSSSEGITPDNVIVEAQRSGIFGSVMEKHYWMPESEVKKQNAASTALRTELESIFSGEKKMADKPVFKNVPLRDDNKELFETIDLGSSEVTATSSPKTDSFQLFSYDTSVPLYGEKVTQKPHYIVRPTGEVIRESSDEAKSIPGELALSSTLTDEQRLQLWFIENKDSQVPFNAPTSVSETNDHPTVWFANKEESGFQQQIRNIFHKPRILEGRKSRDFSKVVRPSSSTLEESLNDGNLHSTRSKKSPAEEYLKKKVRKSVSDAAESIDNVKIQLESPSDFEIILKTLDDKESMLSQVRSQLQEEPDIEEYQVLLTEIEGVLANLAALRSFVLSQCDQNQAKLLAQNKRQSDLFKCSEIISSTSNWLTTTELKLASDDDTYLDDAINENNIYRVLSKEAGSNQLKIQECIHLCELYADSDDNDNTAKDLLGTMTHLQSEVRQISKLIIERLEALQNKPKPIPEVVETVAEIPVEPSLTEEVVIEETCLIPTETSFVQTSPDVLCEKEIQTSLTDGSISLENAEAQTSLNQDLSQTNDTECSEDLSAKSNEDSLDSVQEPDKSEKSITEVLEKDILLDEPESKVPDTSPTSSVSSAVSISSESKHEQDSKNKSKSSKKSKKSKIKEQTADDSQSVVTIQQPVEEITQKEHITHLTDAPTSIESGKPKHVGFATDSIVENTEQTIPKEQSEVIPKEELTSSLITSSKDETIPVKRTPETTEFSRLEDFEFETPSEYQDVTSTTSFSPVDLFTQDFTQLSEMSKEKRYDPRNSETEYRRRAKSLVLGSISETPFFSSTNEPSKTDKRQVTSFDLESNYKESTVPVEAPAEKVLSKTVYSPSNAETVSTSTQCTQETASQGVQSSLEPATKSDKSTLTQGKIPKKKAKRSNTASLTQQPIKIPTPPESPIPLVLEEDVLDKVEDTSVKTSLPDTWKNISEKILLRIRNTNSVPYCSMYLKDSASLVNTAEAVHNFHGDILRIRSFLNLKDEDNLRTSIAEGAEDVSILLDDLNCQIFALKQASHRLPLEEQIANLKAIKQMKTDIDEKCLEPLLHVLDESVPALTENEAAPCRELMEVLKEQTGKVDQAFELVNNDSNAAYQEWCNFINEIQIMKEVMDNMKADLENICTDTDLTIEDQLDALDNMEKLNNEYSANLYELMMRTEKVTFHSPNYKMPDDVFTLFTDIKNIESSIPNKRTKLLQTASEIQDYENMLKLLTQIMDAAANNLLIFPITVSSLPHLQDEMQKYRTFFVHLNHWKGLLESVQENLDEKSRAKYFDMHAQVITRASEILDRGFYYSQKMALAASKWTIIRNSIAEENSWLESVENRFPDLSVIHSFDHERYSIQYSALATDIHQKVTRISQLVDSAHRLRKEISCPELEFGYNKYKEDVISLRDNVNNDICVLETFGENWNLYGIEKSKLLQWINSTEADIGDFDPVSDMQKFWCLQAKFESFNKLNEQLTIHYNNALKLLKIKDQKEQQQIFDELQGRWQKLSEKISALQNKATEKFINSDIPVDQKLSSIEKELNELGAEFSNASEDAHSEEEFQFYCHKAQVMEKAAQRIENELKCYKLLTIPESEKVGSLMNQAQAIAFKINEEVQCALSVEDYLKDMNRRIDQVSRQQLRQNSVLNQCESCLGERQEDIDHALESCEDLMGELQGQWQEITKLCHLFHTFPKRLKINVTLPTLEQQLTHIKNNQEALEDRCKILLNSLKERSALWKRFTDLKREVKECSEVIEFRTDLLSIHGTIDYRRLAAISENLQDLSESLDSRESDLLGDLKSSARNLKLVCNAEVQNEIDYQVDESVQAFNDSRKSLSTLCERYENAVKIWANYRRNSDIVNEWVDDQLHSLSNLPPEEALNQVQVYSKALDEQSTKLSELRAMVMEIANEVGIKEDNLFTDEIMLLSKKLEDVKSAITTINSTNEDQKCADFMGAIEETEKCISSIKKDLQCNGENKSNQESKEQVQKLQSQLHSLSVTDATINNMKLEQAELLTNPENSIHKQQPSVAKILESWQQVFTEAFQQYNRVFATLASDQDSFEALNLWKDYLENIQEFLRSEIPENYDNLSSEQQICQLHENLLLSQNSILLSEKSKRTSPYLAEQMDALGNLHNDTLSSIRNRHDEIKRRLDRWQIYRNELNKLLSWLRGVETEQSHLKLRYMYLITIDHKLNKIQDLLKRLPEGLLSANVLKEQHTELLEGCGPGVRSSVRVELDAAFKRIQNIEAALKTWYEFLNKIKTTAKLYDEKVTKIEEIFQSVLDGIETEFSSDRLNYNVKNLRKKIELIKNYEELVTSIDLEFKTLTEFEDELKEAVDIKDTKKIKQKHWLLTQQQSDLKFQLSTHKFQLEEKIALWMLFDVKRTEFISWSEKLKKRLEQFSSTVNNPDVILRRMELEFCAEVESKKYEFDWFVETCSCLQQQSAEGVSEEDDHNLTTKIEELQSIWSDLNSRTKGRIEKIKSLIDELKSLEQNYGTLISWIRKRKGDLDKTVFFQTFDDSALQEKLKEHESVEEKILSKSSEVTSSVERGTRLIADCDDYNLLLDLRTLICSQQAVEKSWRSLQMECVKAKESILAVWKLIQEILSLCNTNKPWLAEQEEKLKAIEKRYKTTPLSLLQPLRSETESISVGINNRSTQFKLLEEMYSNLLAKNAVHDFAVAQETLGRFENLKLALNRLLKSLNVDLSRWKKYESAHSDLVLRLSQFDAKLTQLQHLDESNIDPAKLYEEKLQKLSLLESSEFESLKKSMQHAETLRSDFSSKKKRNDSDAKEIQKMADEYLNLHKDIKKRIKTLKQYYLKHSPPRSNVNEEVQVETLKFEQDFSAQVDTLPTSLQRKDAFLFELQNTMKETRDNIEKLTELLVSNNMEEISKVTASCQSSVDLMKHLSAVLESQCDMSPTDPALSTVNELDESFQQLLLKIRFQQQQQRQQAESDSEIGRLRCPLCSQRNWSQLNNDIWRLEKWLEHAEAKLQAHPPTPPENIENLEDVIQEHKEFMMYLDSHHDLMVSLNIVGKHLMEHAQDEEQASQLQERMARVNEKWESISTQSLVWLTKLQSSLMENNEFHAVIAELLDWIDKTENSIKNCEPVDLLEETAIVEEKFRKFKKLHKELKRCEPRVASLQAANQVCASQQIEKLETSQDKLNHLRLRLQSLIRVTWLYMLKLGGVLGYDMAHMYASTLSTATALTPLTMSQEFLDESTSEPVERPDSPDSTASNGDDDSQSVLARGHRFLGRVIRASLPIQAFIFVMLGVASLFPRVEEEFTCTVSSGMAWNLEPVLRYPDGPPPT